MTEMTASLIAGGAFLLLVLIIGIAWWLLLERPWSAPEPGPVRPDRSGPTYQGRHVRHRTRWWRELILGVWIGLIVDHVKRSWW